MGAMQIFLSMMVLLTAGYLLLIVRFAIPLLRYKGRPVAKTVQPMVSVIIATRDEEKNIAPCLEGILHQQGQPGPFEVIVSNDHSTDRTAAIVRGFMEQDPLSTLSLVDALPEDKPGKKHAIERAVVASRGDLILTTDADTMRGARWIRAMAEQFGATGKKMVLGPVLLTGNSLFQRMQRLEFLGIMGLTAGTAMAGYPMMCNGANLLYEKKVFGETGGFSGNERFPSGDDQFLLAAVRKKFGKEAAAFALDREAVVTTPAEATLRGFLNQRMRWVSKSKGYTDLPVILTGLLTWLFQAALVAAFAGGIWSPVLLAAAGGSLLVKAAADLLMVVPMARFFGVTNDMWVYLPAQLFQLIYVPLAGITGLFLPYRWKGRLIRA